MLLAVEGGTTGSDRGGGMTTSAWSYLSLEMSIFGGGVGCCADADPASATATRLERRRFRMWRFVVSFCATGTAIG